MIDITQHLQHDNSIIIKWENLTSQSLGFAKQVFIIEDNTTPYLGRQVINNTPSWINSAYIYSVYTRNFSEEGTFKKVEEKLEDLKKLNINTLWFLPIHPTGIAGRKGELGSPYAIKDYYAINPEFGTLEDFKRLVKKAHDLGIKVIIDLVINHTALDSVMWYEDKRYFKPDGILEAQSWGWSDVVVLDYSYPPTRQYIKDMMEYWIREADIDGFRCDVAFLIPHDFWKETIDYLRTIKPDIMMLAESDAPELYFAGFDLTYDWVLSALFSRVDQGYFNISAFYNYINAQFDYFPSNALRMTFIENHDIPRSADILTPEGLELSHFIRFFLPGVPLLYNGEEIGYPKYTDLFNKDHIDWSKINPIIRDYFMSIPKFRNHPALNHHLQSDFEYHEIENQAIFKRIFGKEVIELVIDRKNKTILIIDNGEELLKHKLTEKEI